MVFEGHPQFRYDLYADYKANRIIKTASKQESRDKFIKTMDIIIPLLQYMPITMASAANYEADDTIGSLCENMRDEDITVLSSDSDFTQLLQRGYKQIRIYNPIKKEFVVPPTWHYVTWKCLNGDKSDNIPSLLKPKKAIETASDPEKLRKFMEVEEQRASFQVNRQLIDFANVPEEEIVLTEGIRQFDLLKQHFADMKFESIINDTSWERFTKTFDCVKY
jgi:5'-3' exonuclease